MSSAITAQCVRTALSFFAAQFKVSSNRLKIACDSVLFAFCSFWDLNFWRSYFGCLILGFGFLNSQSAVVYGLSDDLLRRRQTLKHKLLAVIPQRDHSVMDRFGSQFVGGHIAKDHVPQIVIHDH